METEKLFEKMIEFAENGKGRRLLNSLSSKGIDLVWTELDTVLKTYRDVGLPKEVEMLKKMRGILTDDQYNMLADAVRENCCYEKYDAFAASLRNLLRSGMTMNPARMNDPENEKG